MRHLVLIGLIGVVLATLAGAAYVAWYVETPLTIRKLPDEFEIPEGTRFRGPAHILEAARRLVAEPGDNLADSTDLEIFRSAAERTIFGEILETCKTLRIHFDVFTNELDLVRGGQVDAVVNGLRERGLVATDELRRVLEPRAHVSGAPDYERVVAVEDADDLGIEKVVITQGHRVPVGADPLFRQVDDTVGLTGRRTGGPTPLLDKRHVRRGRAAYFCPPPAGIPGDAARAGVLRYGAAFGQPRHVRQAAMVEPGIAHIGITGHIPGQQADLAMPAAGMGISDDAVVLFQFDLRDRGLAFPFAAADAGRDDPCRHD